jgi:valyl-tRNA synthetase
MTDLESRTRFEPAEVEARIAERWLQSGLFHPEAEGSPAENYSIAIPPPNVTGALHMGHALNGTVQDCLIRLARMEGRRTKWIFGTDHAGIATQKQVEQLLVSEGTTRREIGREAFTARVWQWREQYGSTIVTQLKRLGASCDFADERFTLDDRYVRAVLEVFVALYDKGLIYRDNRIVNWDPGLGSAISDLEVEEREVTDTLYSIAYPLEGGGEIVVATVRPETMLADTAVAVNPEDERYRDLVGKHCILPLVGRRIPIVADAYADPEQGSGAVKITPAHDFNDFEVGKRHGLPMINILDVSGRLNDEVPEAYRGLDRFEARKRVVADIEAAGLLEKIDDHLHTVPYGDRGGVPIEPYLTDQWFVNAAVLAEPAIRAVEEGRTRFVPENWSKTYFEWMRNIQPWCVSRQLWWGHQIPAWYGPDGEIFVAMSEAEAEDAAEKHYGKRAALTRDPDVLDTWFSSALWPFSTLGWPDRTPELGRFYPTSALVTGFDIIFFWVARMMMMGLHFMDDAPFHTVYVHALVRDEKGQKMSKSKGNVIDPLDLIGKYGADALRFTLSSLAAPGRDIRLAESRVEGSRNFATKLWNAARFCEINGCVPQPGFDPASPKEPVNRWIVGEVARCAATVTDRLQGYRFNEASQALYQFIWGTYCDWYLEFCKPFLLGGDAAAKAETQATAGWALDQILLLLHPFMPFVTEELWANTAESRPSMLIRSAWPSYPAGLADAGADRQMDWVVRLVTGIRSVRSEMNVPPAAEIPMVITGLGAEGKVWLAAHEPLIWRLARLKDIRVGAEIPKGAVQLVLDEATVALPIAEVIDIGQEKQRLQKEIAKAESEIQKLQKKLSNQQFLAKAPEAVVDEQRERLAEEESARAKLDAALKRLSAVA